jgi:thiamine biosynthesis lipoprotein
MTSEATLEFKNDHWIGRFTAMASPCEILIDSDDQQLAAQLLQAAEQEALRIEQKFSRYRQDNITYQINQSQGQAVEVDEETASLLDYAQQCYEISDGKFDVTSGVLRKLWNFDGSDRIPTQQQIDTLLNNIGWQKISWQRPFVRVPAGMEIDLGGIGKEYAVDRSALILAQLAPVSVLVNYGGDLMASKARRGGQGWVVGVEDPAMFKKKKNKLITKTEFELLQGGIATSGDTRRYLLKNGVRYSHILDPRTGWPVKNAPHSVTVAAGTCTEAGILATLAMLHGRQAEAFLKAQEVRFWCQR